MSVTYSSPLLTLTTSNFLTFEFLMRICLLKRVGVQENLLRKHSWKHHPPLLKAGGRTFQTFSHLGGGEGYQKFGWKVGINLKRWVGWYRNGGIATFLLIYIFNCIYSVCARARVCVCVCVCVSVCVWGE